jgi:H/ACA ribonucleoprotein complex subunit 2
MAGDVSPMDVISHIPVLCEDNEIPYIFIPSRADLGFSCATKRPTSVVMIVPDRKNEDNNLEYKESLEKCLNEVKELVRLNYLFVDLKIKLLLIHFSSII